MMKRRDALKTIGGLAGAAGLARLLPGCGSSSDGGPKGITTYVLMMMENRSYDHLLGARSMLEGKAGEGLQMTMTNPDLNGAPIALWHPDITQQCDLDPPHGFDAARLQFNAGANDGFVKVHQMDHGSTTAIEPMQYLTRQDVPVTWALADAYTSCDHWFCSVMGPTWPNRFYWHTGSSGGISNNSLPSMGLTWPSLYNRLQDAGVEWGYYYGSIPVLSALNNPGPFQLDSAYVQQRVKRFDTEFFKDAAAGTLPPVTYIDPNFFYNDDHPAAHPINGQALIASVYTALAQSPQWKNCMLIITYDENGGFFDHVPPPRTVDDYAAQDFDQMGFRVPTIVAGPYVKTGNVSSVVYDHTSALRHLTDVFGLEPLNQRTVAANDLNDCIDHDRLAKGEWNPPIELPEVDPGEWADYTLHPECGVSNIAKHPVHEWADAHPEAVAGYDLRAKLPEYQQHIRDFLKASRRQRVR